MLLHSFIQLNYDRIVKLDCLKRNKTASLTNSTFTVTLYQQHCPEWWEVIIFMHNSSIHPPGPGRVMLCSSTTSLRMLFDTLDLKRYATGSCPRKGCDIIYTICLKENLTTATVQFYSVFTNLFFLCFSIGGLLRNKKPVMDIRSTR